MVFVFSLGIAPVSVCVLTTGVVIRRRAASGETARGGFVLEDSFTRSELGNDIGLMGALLLFVLRACCGSMCWPGDRPATHAAAGAAARGVRGIGGLFHALRRDGTRGLVSGLRAASGEDGTRG